MVIAAVETVTRRGSLALWKDGNVTSYEGPETPMHGERLPVELITWLASKDVALADIDVFAVVTGPGSFTGMRVGIAAVQGFALAASRRVVPIPTLDALAATVRLDAHAPSGIVVPCLDGQRGEVFAAAFDLTSSDDPREWTTLVEPVAGLATDLAPRIASLAKGRDVFLVGNGTDKYEAVFGAALPDARRVAQATPIAEAAVRLAAIRPSDAVAPHALRPIYLRRPDAELARERQRTAPSEPRFRVRRADVTADLAAVEAIQRQTFTNPWGAEAIRWELENTDVARLYVLEGPERQLVAYCACWMIFDELHINSLAVDTAWRRQGAARTLVRQVLSEAVLGGARAATLEVRRSNEPACSLYEGLGFSVGGVRKDYYQDPREDALILWNRAISG